MKTSCGITALASDRWGEIRHEKFTVIVISQSCALDSS